MIRCFLHNRRRVLERLDRVTHVIEHATEENHIEQTNALGANIHDVDIHVLDLGAEDFTGQQKTLFVAPPGTIPTERIGGQHPRRAALLRLKRIEAVPGAQIEKRLARQVLRQVEPFELAA